jgi:hypothetical protein
MPLIEKIYLAVVILAFLIFAGTLAWGDAQCRSARRHKAKSVGQGVRQP